MAEIQKKCAEKQLKIRTGNWFLPGLMIVLLLLGAAAVTCLHFGIQDQKRAARLLDEVATVSQLPRAVLLLALSGGGAGDADFAGDSGAGGGQGAGQ